MEFIVKINMDNAAFDNPVEEIQRILEGIVEVLEHDSCICMNKTLRDSNGNTVGFAGLAD